MGRAAPAARARARWPCARRAPRAVARAPPAASRSRAGSRALSGWRSPSHLRPSAHRRRHVPDGTQVRAQVLLAMGLLYIVWGSTYLAIRVTVETLHPLAAGGI